MYRFHQITAHALVVSVLFLSCAKGGPYRLRECKITHDGSEYEGTINVSNLGNRCQRWDSQEPNAHEFTEPHFFPDASMDDAANNCRNPDLDGGGPWCYTIEGGQRYEYCDVPICPTDLPECKLTMSGTEYLGGLSETISGQTCLPWESSPEDSNFCRNPDSKPNGPWCFVNGEDWEYCDVPFCKPSANCRITDFGGEYVGRVAWTNTGIKCQRWDKQAPQSHTFTEDSDFPDATVEDAGNYCRNPDQEPGGPWCYTTDPNVRFESCDVALCEDCKSTDDGREYAGMLTETVSGLGCQRWDSQEPHPHEFTDPNRFPDVSVEAAQDYCRNPDGKADGPWCYTGNPDVEWDTCNIPYCSGDEHRPIKKIKHVVHLGIDGLTPSCMFEAPGGLANIWGRIGSQGAYSLNGRTVLVTVSAPGWTANLCGMGVETSGVTGNGWSPPWMGANEDITPVTGTNIPLSCVFQTIKSQDNSIQTSAYYSWNWFRNLASHGIPGSLDKDWYCEYDYPACDLDMTALLTAYLPQVFQSTESSYTFVYYGNLDDTGHSSQWCSQSYLDVLGETDSYIGELLDVIEASGMTDDTLILLSSDHGGHDYGHGSYIDDDLLIPVFVKGPGVKVGYEFPQEVRNQDLVPTALHRMGLKQSQWMKGDILEDAFED